MKRFCIFLITLILTTFSILSSADSIIAENSPHSGWNIIPFGEACGPTVGRYQQVYGSSLFTTPVLISSISFSTHQPSDYFANVSLAFTTTSVAVGALSAALDSNFSVPLSEVFADPSFFQELEGGSESFGLVFDFSANPFVYDPAVGNLLLDIVISEQQLIPHQYPSSNAFSQGSTSASVYSRAWNIPHPSFPAGSDGGGLRTKFEFQPIVATKKTHICHWQADNYAWKLIKVGTASVASHFANHDDAFPGGTTAHSGTELDENCAITLPPCGDCLQFNGTPGCENGACTDIVCGIDPFCCDSFWDDLCADEASEFCVDEVCQGETGAETICGIPKPLEEGICVCGFPELGCTSTVVNCETSDDCSEVFCGGLPTCVEAGNDYPNECGPDNSERCFYVD